MEHRRDVAGGRGSKAPPPARHSNPAEPSSPAPFIDAPDVVDPELVSDLGAEFELRGDVMESELEAARAEAAELRDRVLRGQAEFDNFRKRTAREREDERKRATRNLVMELLPAIDNLERAIDHGVDSNAFALSASLVSSSGAGELRDLLSGVEVVHAQILAALGKQGVEVIDPLGEPFDPMTQQAVSQQEDAEVPDGTVLSVFQKGYSMGGLVIRHAMVVVSTGGPPGGA
jgi:molecular chaperone GrpE